MSSPSPSPWKEVNEYLDQALTLPEERRAAWLAALRQQKPEVAEQVQSLLQEHRAVQAEGFLEERPGPVLVQVASAGQTVGAYTLVSPIGQGGMGTVWLAERSDGRFQRRAAVKFLSVALFGRGEERFKQEGSMLARLVHPHIAQLLDAGIVTGGQPYLILEHVEGEPVDGYCDSRQLDARARISVFLQVVEAVAHAHANLIVHRDLKPSNVLVRNDGQVKLLDFGIAKLLQAEEGRGATQLTQEGGGALTPAYAAPEQITAAPITTATDVYALGVLLYVLLTGQHPAGAGNLSTAEMVKALVETEPARPSAAVMAAEAASPTRAAAIAAKRGTSAEKLSRALRGDLDTIILKALKKEPRERYASVTALGEDLRRYLRHEAISARPDTLAYRAGKFVQRNRLAVTLASVALLAIVAGLAGTLVQARTARAQRDFAVHQLARAEAVNEFNEFLLSDAAPSGKPFTVNELLGRAEQILARQSGAKDTNYVELLVQIGRQYSTQDDEARAQALLEKAYRLSRGMNAPITQARASCSLAATLARTGDLVRAEALFQEGLAQIPQLPEFALERNYCLLRGSEVAREAGNVARGIGRAQAALLVMKDSPFTPEKMELHTALDLAESYRMAGQHREAIAAFEKVAQALTALGRDQTQTAAVLYNNWALALEQLGRPLEAEPLYRRAIDVSRAGQAEDTVSPMILNNYAKVLWALNRLARAADYAERAYQKAKQNGNEVVVNQALLVRAGVYTEQGNGRRAAAMLAEVEPRLRKDLPAGHYAFAALASAQGRVAQVRGDLPLALQLADRAVQVDEAAIKAGGQGAFLLPRILLRRASTQLAAGHYPEAETDANRAAGLLQRTAGARCSDLGNAYLTIARAQQAQGQHEPARSGAARALAQLEPTLGPDHPETVAARQLAEAARP